MVLSGNRSRRLHSIHPLCEAVIYLEYDFVHARLCTGFAPLSIRRHPKGKISNRYHERHVRGQARHHVICIRIQPGAVDSASDCPSNSRMSRCSRRVGFSEHVLLLRGIISTTLTDVSTPAPLSPVMNRNLGQGNSLAIGRVAANIPATGGSGTHSHSPCRVPSPLSPGGIRK